MTIDEEGEGHWCPQTTLSLEAIDTQIALERPVRKVLTITS